MAGASASARASTRNGDVLVQTAEAAQRQPAMATSLSRPPSRIKQDALLEIVVTGSGNSSAGSSPESSGRLGSGQSIASVAGAGAEVQNGKPLELPVKQNGLTLQFEDKGLEAEFARQISRSRMRYFQYVIALVGLLNVVFLGRDLSRVDGATARAAVLSIRVALVVASLVLLRA